MHYCIIFIIFWRHLWPDFMCKHLHDQAIYACMPHILLFHFLVSHSSALWSLITRSEGFAYDKLILKKKAMQKKDYSFRREINEQT